MSREREGEQGKVHEQNRRSGREKKRKEKVRLGPASEILRPHLLKSRLDV